LHFLIAHRPGFVFPTVAARSFATLDQFTEGRVALHAISGGNDAEQRRDGDYLPKDERYARTDEYLEILHTAWTTSEPFSFHGRYYNFENFSSEVRPFQQPRIPIYFGGSSNAAYQVGARHADVYALWGEPLAETASQIAAVREEAARYGRSPRFSVSFRPILGPTEALAWERAERTLAAVQESVRASKGQFAPSHIRYSPGREPENAGSQRLLAAAAAGERHDRALWTPLAAATGAAGNSTALVGTPETVAQALLDYVEIGVTTLLIRGYDPYDDAIEYGRHLLPLVRTEVERRERQSRTDTASEICEEASGAGCQPNAGAIR
jgi:alkanesulfonate monooxygenase